MFCAREHSMPPANGCLPKCHTGPSLFPHFGMDGALDRRDRGDRLSLLVGGLPGSMNGPRRGGSATPTRRNRCRRVRARRAGTLTAGSLSCLPQPSSCCSRTSSSCAKEPDKSLAYRKNRSSCCRSLIGKAPEQLAKIEFKVTLPQ